jgi:Flp pilus assembly protein TadD
MQRDSIRRNSRYAAVMLALISATALAGCQQKSAGLDAADPFATASTGPVSYQAAAELGKNWQSDPTNINKGMAYANALESIGQSEKQLEVYGRLSMAHPANGKLAGIYGKKLLTSGKSAEAIPVLERAATASGVDWRIHSALGSAYDQQGLYQKARAEYQTVLSGDSGNLSVLNNLGMSYALEGNLKEAETTLRRADGLPRSRSEPRIRQNLALVVGLLGRFEEASKIASEDLPQEQIEANMAYLQKMLAQPNTWQQISNGADG